MTPTPLDVTLYAELREARSIIAALTDRLEALQAANEAAYREAYNATGGPRFDPTQAFGEAS